MSIVGNGNNLRKISKFVSKHVSLKIVVDLLFLEITLSTFVRAGLWSLWSFREDVQREKNKETEFVLSICFDDQIVSRHIYSSLIFLCVVVSYLLVPIIVLKLGSFRLFKLTRSWTYSFHNHDKEENFTMFFVPIGNECFLTVVSKNTGTSTTDSFLRCYAC